MQRIINIIFPKEEKFFNLLKEQSRNTLDTAEELKRFVSAYNGLDEHKKKEAAAHLKKLERKGDELVHTIITELDKSFITPFDKEDIHKLTDLLDDVTDLIEAISVSFVMYDLNKVDDYIKKIVDILVSAVAEVNKAVSSLNKLSNMREFHIKINSLENESDKLYTDAVSSLFRNCKDPTEIIKHNDIYKMLEDTVDKCEDLTYVIENIVVKHV